MSVQYKRSFSATSRRSMSGMSANHVHHPSIPENEVLSEPSYTQREQPSSPVVDSTQTQSSNSPDYDRSAELLVQSWMSSNNFSPTPKSEPRAVERINDMNSQQEESTGFKSFVIWGERKVVISLPRDLVYSQPNLLSGSEMQAYEKRVQEWAICNCESLSPMFTKTGEIHEFRQALTTGRAVVQIPNDKANKHVSNVRDQRQPLAVFNPQPQPESFSSLHVASPEVGYNQGYNSFKMYMPQAVAPAVPQYYQHQSPVQNSGPVPLIPSRTPVTPLSATAAAFVPPTFVNNMNGLAQGGLNISFRGSHQTLDSPFEFSDNGSQAELHRSDNNKKQQFQTPSDRRPSRFTPIVQSGTPARELSKEELDGIVSRLTKTVPARDSHNDSGDETESVLSDSAVSEQRIRLASEAAKLDQHVDDATLEKILGDALKKKLDPLERLVTVLADQLKTRQAEVSEGDDEDASDESAVPYPRRPSPSRTITGELSTETGDSRVVLRAELEEAKRARERADATAADLTQRLLNSERDTGSLKNKLESLQEEIQRVRLSSDSIQSAFKTQLEDQETVIKKDMQREIDFANQRRDIYKEQVQLLQEQVQLLNDKLQNAASDAERAVEAVKARVARTERERDDILSHRATELSWLRGYLDTNVDNLEEQARMIKASLDDRVERQSVENLYNSNNSEFLTKLRFGTALSLVSDEFVEILTSVSNAMIARGVTQKDHRRRLSRQILMENIKPLNEHNNNVQSTSPVRTGFGGSGLKDLRLNRAATIHGQSTTRGERRRLFKEI
ncbi:hypothetical protein V1512DRAFT_258584 [Lipomyces arxii]|uniref:uncharacterized protein n=1 Tax=Lipomyces arxii TaxID=56418 RepID=UPI0034CD6427